MSHLTAKVTYLAEVKGTRDDQLSLGFSAIFSHGQRWAEVSFVVPHSGEFPLHCKEL